MPDFDDYVSRHGEAAAQWLIETLERVEGVRPTLAALEERWTQLQLSGRLTAANSNEANHV